MLFFKYENNLKIGCEKYRTVLKCTQMRARVEKVDVLGWNKSYPNPKIIFYASDMVLHVDSDAAYLVQTNAQRRYAGYYYIGSPKSTTALSFRETRGFSGKSRGYLAVRRKLPRLFELCRV